MALQRTIQRTLSPLHKIIHEDQARGFGVARRMRHEEKKRNYLQQYEDDDEFLLGKVRATPQSNASHYMYETVRIFPNHQRRLASDS